MIKILIINLFLIFNNGDFCEGFENGYADGYCYEKIGCMSPIAPPCPMLKYTDEDSYKGGYNRGFTIGYRAGHR